MVDNAKDSRFLPPLRVVPALAPKTERVPRAAGGAGFEGGGVVEIVDISRTVEPAMPLYPGTEPPSRGWLMSMEDGDPSNISEWKLNSHTGTHLDARKHFVPDGWTMEGLDLSRSVGPCRVVDLTHVEGHVSRKDLEGAAIAD